MGLGAVAFFIHEPAYFQEGMLIPKYALLSATCSSVWWWQLLFLVLVVALLAPGRRRRSSSGGGSTAKRWPKDAGP